MYLKTASIFLIVLSLLLLGSLMRNIYLIFATLPLFSYLVFISSFSRKFNLDLEVKRNLSKEIIREDEELVVSIEIKNRGDDIEQLFIKDNLEEGIEIISGSCSILTSIKKGEIIKYNYIIKAREIGKFKIGPLQILAMNNSGIESKKLILNQIDSFKVSPVITLLSKFKIRTKFFRPWPGEVASNRIGIGGEFHSIREAESGDILKRINWKATARAGKLMKNVYDAELGSDVLIILDHRAVNNVKISKRSLLIYSSRLALILAYRLLRDKYRVGFLLISEGFQRIMPSFGKKQFDRIIYAVLDAEPGKLVDLRLLKDYVSFSFPLTTLIIFISPILDLEVVYALAELAKKGYQIICISPMPFEKKPLREMNLVEKILRIERDNYLSILNSLMPVVEWDVEKPFNVDFTRVIRAWLRR